MFACVYNRLVGRNVWRREIDIDEIESLFGWVDQENDCPSHIAFDPDGGFDFVTNPILLYTKTKIVNFLYQHQLAIDFTKTPLLKKIMQHVNPRYVHSRHFFDTRIHHLWSEHVIHYLKHPLNYNEYQERARIIRCLLVNYNELDMEYRFSESVKLDIRHIYQFRFSSLHNHFYNAMGETRSLEDIVQGILVFGEKKGLFQTSFYRIFLVATLKELLCEIFISSHLHSFYPFLHDNNETEINTTHNNSDKSFNSDN